MGWNTTWLPVGECIAYSSEGERETLNVALPTLNTPQRHQATTGENQGANQAVAFSPQCTDTASSWNCPVSPAWTSTTKLQKYETEKSERKETRLHCNLFK